MMILNGTHADQEHSPQPLSQKRQDFTAKINNILVV